MLSSVGLESFQRGEGPLEWAFDMKNTALKYSYNKTNEMQ